MNFRELLEDMGYEAQSYSGRAMYGKQCLGVVVDSCYTPFQFFAELIDTATDEAINRFYLKDDVAAFSEVFYEISKVMRNTRTDSMGLGTIIYWPNILWEEEDEEEKLSSSA